MGPRIALTSLERHTLQTLSDHHSVAGAADALGLSMAELATTLTAIRTRLGVSSTTAALAHLDD